MELTCRYCGNKTELVTGDIIYKHRPDLKDKKFFICFDCGAYVGCHRNGEPLGIVANKNLRKMRLNAHNAFDEIWKSNIMTRSDAYKFLREKLNISKDECHIAMFNEDMCKKVVDVSLYFLKNIK